MTTDDKPLTNVPMYFEHEYITLIGSIGDLYSTYHEQEEQLLRWWTTPPVPNLYRWSLSRERRNNASLPEKSLRIVQLLFSLMLVYPRSSLTSGLRSKPHGKRTTGTDVLLHQQPSIQAAAVSSPQEARAATETNRFARTSVRIFTMSNIQLL